MLKWLKQNRNWFFSGIGVFIIVSVISLVDWLWNDGYIPTWIDSMRSQPMVTAIVILAGLLLITSSMLLATTVRRRQSLGYQKVQDADQSTSEDSIMSHEVIEDGLKYITDTILTNLAKHGGSITTTAIFENYRDGDKVQMFLEDLHLPENSQATIEFTRLLLLDDPSKEYEWLREFLSLKTIIQSTTHGFSVIPKILHIRSKRRPLIRYLSSSIPKVSATIVEFRRPINSKSRHLVYFGFWGGHIEHSFGIVFRDSGMFTLTQRFLNVYQQRATLYEDSEQIPSLFFDPRVSLLRRIQDRLLELAEQRDDIVHLGLFGSRSLVENQFLSEKDCTSHEADLDVVVVLAESCAISSAIKTTITNAIYAERFPNEPIPEIEFSNLDGKYYEIRADLHIDIQLHNKGDRYYNSTAELLSYSIFGGAYVSLYSATKEPIYVYLPRPTEIPSLTQRVRLVIHSKEYGLTTAIERVGNYYKYRNTDPYRVTWIQLCNTVWALTGTRPYTFEQAVSSLKKEVATRMPGSTLAEDCHALLASPQPNGHSEKTFRLKCRKVLQGFLAVLEGKGT